MKGCQKICLATLCSSVFTPTMSRQYTAKSTGNISPFSKYAAASFSFHLTHGTSSAHSLALLNKFLHSTNILAWIEHIAKMGDLSILQEANHRLKGCLSRRNNDMRDDNMDLSSLEPWVTDIDRIIAIFQSCLLDSPASIYFLAPYLCPHSSIINRLFSKFSTRFRVAGLAEKSWGDRLTCYLFFNHPTAVACNDHLLAIALSDGSVSIYRNTEFSSFEPVGTVSHGGRVRQVAFDPKVTILATCSARKLSLWDVRTVDGSSFPCIWSQPLDFLACEVAFTPDGESTSHLPMLV